jgi:hypothetical protein
VFLVVRAVGVWEWKVEVVSEMLRRGLDKAYTLNTLEHLHVNASPHSLSYEAWAHCEGSNRIYSVLRFICQIQDNFEPTHSLSPSCSFPEEDRAGLFYPVVECEIERLQSRESTSS